MKRLLKGIKSERGQALVEFALVLPLLLLLILGMMEYGWLLNGKITLTSATREGARTAVLYDNTTAAEADVLAKVKQSASGSGLSIVSAKPQYVSPSVTVEAKGEIKPIVGLFVTEDEVTMTSKATMRIEK